MSYYFLLTALPDIPNKVVLGQALDTSVENILSFIHEHSLNNDFLYSIYLSEDLKNIFAKLQNVSFIFTKFNLLDEKILNKSFEEILEDENFPYTKFFTNVNFKKDILKLEWELFNKFIESIKEPLIKEYYTLDSAIKYMFEINDIDKKEYFVDLFDSNFHKTYILAKELFDTVEHFSSIDKEIYVANLKLAYIQELEKNKSFTQINLEAYILKLLIHNRFISLNKDVSKNNLKEFINFKLEF